MLRYGLGIRVGFTIRKRTMPVIKRVVLDVLKPHQPNALEFATALAERHSGCHITVTVIEVDEKTETTMLAIESEDVPYDAIVDTIGRLGASVHSIDEVEVCSERAET
jgi:hypothetical protein